MREKGRQLAKAPDAPRMPASELPRAVRASRPTKRHNDGPWRNACIERYGEVCRSCGDTAHVQMDHVIPKSQDSTARADVENGLPLCGEFSRNTPGGCHPKKTRSELRFDPRWFEPEQIAYFARKGWVAWDAEGQPFGRGMNHFLPMAGRELKGGQHGEE